MVVRTVMAAIVGVTLGGGAQGSAAPAAGHDLMPAPAKLAWHEGRLALGRKLVVVIRGACDERVEGGLTRLARVLERDGVRLDVTRKPAGRAGLVVECREAGAPIQSVEEDESYALTIDARQARLVAPNPLGALHGLVTFGQLVERGAAGSAVRAVVIEDAPRFRWRGIHVDACRHWQPVEVIERTLEAMALVKLNVLHWHLTEDQGFRIESRRFPRLHERGAEGHYYTQDEVRAVIAFARARGIRVVPEFDMPGHSTSWLVGHPELGSAPGPFELIRSWGIFDNCLDPSREEVYTFLDGFLGEMGALFPDAFLHIGGDEVTPRQWNANPAIQEFLYARGLRTAHDLQSYFNQRVSAIVTRHGKTMVGWDEILHPTLPKTTVIHSWRGPQSLAEAARQGFRGVLSNGYYLDLYFPASHHYLVDPLPAGSSLAPEEQARVLGGEACMWSEYVTPEIIDSRLWPRGAAIAERLWSPREVRDVADMYRRLEITSVRLEAAGTNHRSGYEPMLARLTGGRPTEPLRRLADVVTPVKEYRRGGMRVYTSDTPLDRLVDVVRPESDTARHFADAVEGALAAAPDLSGLSALRPQLEAWRDTHALLEPTLQASDRTKELLVLSRDLSALGAMGLEAVEALVKRQPPAAAWCEQGRQLLDGAQAPRAEVELAIIPSLRKLALAAEHVAELSNLSGAEWNAKLESAVSTVTAPAGH